MVSVEPCEGRPSRNGSKGGQPPSFRAGSLSVEHLFTHSSSLAFAASLSYGNMVPVNLLALGLLLNVLCDF